MGQLLFWVGMQCRARGAMVSAASPTGEDEIRDGAERPLLLFSMASLLGGVLRSGYGTFLPIYFLAGGGLLS